MKLLHSFFAVLFLLSISMHVSSKNTEFNGKITTFDKIPLNKVSVVVMGTNNEVFTGNDGNFRITCNEDDKLLISANGFVSKKVSLSSFDGEMPITVNLKLKKGERNYELATVHGHVKAETLSHAIDLVDSKLDYGSYASIIDILTEKENRVNVGQSGVSIVGMKGTPLYVVDGSEVHYSYFKGIPTSDIESIAVLRNTASARYGMKGYGGVIEVVTKSN